MAFWAAPVLRHLLYGLSSKCSLVCGSISYLQFSFFFFFFFFFVVFVFFCCFFFFCFFFFLFCFFFVLFLSSSVASIPVSQSYRKIYVTRLGRSSLIFEASLIFYMCYKIFNDLEWIHFQEKQMVPPAF